MIEEKDRVVVTLVEFSKTRTIEVAKNTSLQVFFDNNLPRPAGNPIVGAKINSTEYDLWFNITEDCTIEPIDLSYYSGVKVYERSVVLLLIKALADLYPNTKLEVHHAISRGIYCEFKGNTDINTEAVQKILDYMKKLVINALPFSKQEVTLEEARNIFIQNNQEDKLQLLEKHKGDSIVLYGCDNLIVTFYAYTVPNASYLKYFDLIHYGSGVILRFPDQQSRDTMPEYIEQHRLFRVFQEHKHWVKILGVDTIGNLNNTIRKGEIGDFIRVAEAIHEKKIAHIADKIATDQENICIILISGPSSSGKTTFSKRLAVHLRVNGIKAIPLSLDDYFKDHDVTPRDELGELNFECIETLDLALLNKHLKELLDGNPVDVPKYDFSKGKRSDNTSRLQLHPNELLILEGIHGLNPKLTPAISELNKFKIYVSALTVLNIDSYNRIPTTDLRIIRRIVRDKQFRGYSAEETLKRWESIRRGENENIFPYQHYANVMFNSAMAYELAILKILAIPALQEIPLSSPVYSEAKRLLNFLTYFEDIDSRAVPNNSILREFIGNSIFKY